MKFYQRQQGRQEIRSTLGRTWGTRPIPEWLGRFRDAFSRSGFLEISPDWRAGLSSALPSGFFFRLGIQQLMSVLLLALVSTLPLLAAPPQIRFENRQKRSGISFVLDNGTVLAEGSDNGVAPFAAFEREVKGVFWIGVPPTTEEAAARGGGRLQ